MQFVAIVYMVMKFCLRNIVYRSTLHLRYSVNPAVFLVSLKNVKYDLKSSMKLPQTDI